MASRARNQHVTQADEVEPAETVEPTEPTLIEGEPTPEEMARIDAELGTEEAVLTEAEAPEFTPTADLEVILGQPIEDVRQEDDFDESNYAPDEEDEEDEDDEDGEDGEDDELSPEDAAAVTTAPAAPAPVPVPVVTKPKRAVILTPFQLTKVVNKMLEDEGVLDLETGLPKKIGSPMVYIYAGKGAFTIFISTDGTGRKECAPESAYAWARDYVARAKAKYEAAAANIQKAAAAIAAQAATPAE